MRKLKEENKKIGLLDKVLNSVERVGNKLPDPVTIFFILCGIIFILSAIISTMLHLIFTKVPEEILNLTPTKIITSLLTNREHFEMFVLVVIAFMMFVLLTVFKVFDLKDYKSKNYKVTDNIEIPMPVRR